MKKNQTPTHDARRTARSAFQRQVGAGVLAAGLTLSAGAQTAAEAPTNLLAQSVQTISRVEAAQQAQAETLRKLLERIDQLEKKSADEKALAEKLKQAYDEEKLTHVEREKQLQGKIVELEGKVGSLEAGRVLPEIALPTDDAPTTTELQQQIRILERKNELAAEAADARAKAAPRLTAGQDGFSFTSADTNFNLRVKGLLQMDFRAYLHDNPLSEGNNSFVLRRVRPIFEGRAFKDFTYNFTPDFAGSGVTIFDAWLKYELRPELQLQFGKFKGPVGQEQLQSDSTLNFNERGLPASLVPTRSVGIELSGDMAGGLVSYGVGVFNSGGDGRNPGTSDFDDSKEAAGRVFFKPFVKSEKDYLSGLGFGVGGSYNHLSGSALGLPNTTGGSLPGYTTPGQQQFFAYNPVLGRVQADGLQWRVSPHIQYTYGALGLLGEYAISHQTVLNTFTGSRGELEHSAWQVAAQWVLTGEAATFSGINPKRPFDFRTGQWGAWQLVARYGGLTIDPHAFPVFADPRLSANGITSWSVGINWWLNKNFRVLTSYAHTTFQGGGAFNVLDPSTTVPPATVAHQDEDALFTRIQLSF
jgi:phosphate-selective porin OprO/OprP